QPIVPQSAHVWLGRLGLLVNPLRSEPVDTTTGKTGASLARLTDGLARRIGPCRWDTGSELAASSIVDALLGAWAEAWAGVPCGMARSLIRPLRSTAWTAWEDGRNLSSSRARIWNSMLPSDKTVLLPTIFAGSAPPAAILIRRLTEIEAGSSTLSIGLARICYCRWSSRGWILARCTTTLQPIT